MNSRINHQYSDRKSPSFSLSGTSSSSRKTAVMVLSSSMVTVISSFVPVASPVHSTNTQPSAGSAVSVTEVPSAYTSKSGSISTVPSPSVFTVSSYVSYSASCSKTAVIVLLPSMVTLISSFVPVASPVHSTNTQPSADSAVSVTSVPSSYSSNSGSICTVPSPSVLIDSSYVTTPSTVTVTASEVTPS